MKAKTFKPTAALQKRAKPAPPLTFEEWKRRAGVPLLGTRYMKPRDWRNLFISGATPEQAAQHLERPRYNALDAPRLRGKKR